MSSSAFPLTDVGPRLQEVETTVSPAEIVATVVRTFASLKLTVTLFALGIFVVLVGTLAQQEASIGQVVRDYFHAWLMWVDVNLLFPKMFLPWVPEFHIPAPGFLTNLTGGFVTNLNTFPAPGGLAIGTLMAINLLAAHGLRFTIQAKGLRLFWGTAVLLIGLAVGLLIIWSGHSSTGFQTKPPFSWDAFWTAFLLGCTVLWCALAFPFAVYGVGSFVQRSRKEPTAFIEIVLLLLLAVPLLASAWAIGYGFLSGHRPADEAIRIVWQLLQGGLAGLILLAGCVMIFRKRGGMVLLHLGIGLLIFNELWVAMTARERQVFMQEGQTVDYLRDIRTIELAFVDRSAPSTDEHVVVPREQLVENYRKNPKGSGLTYIDNEMLPVKLAVVKYFDNADVRDLAAEEKTPATAGRGLKEALVERPVNKGTDTDGGVDLAGAYVTFTDKSSGRDLGTFLLSQLASEQKFPERFAEKLTVGDKSFDLFLRFKREYKPFTMSLVDVRKDDYLASDTPRNYSSDVKIVDPDNGVEETVHIKMNDPLRYRGDTFYQSGYHKLPDGEATTLQVVLNRGWMIPYVACMVVVIGMVAHFLIAVTRFVGRREAEELAAGDVIRAELLEEPGKKMVGTAHPTGKKKSVGRKAAKSGFDWSAVGLPALAAGLFLLVVGSAIRAPEVKPQEMDLVRFGQLPVGHLGRIKPIDTLARNALRTLTINYETAKTADGKKIPAVQWFLDVISGSDAALKMPVIRIDSPEVRRIFDLPKRKGLAYSVEELQPHIGEFEKQVEAAHKADEEQRTVEQRRILELDERLKLYITLVRAFSPPDLPQVPSEEATKADPSVLQQFVARYRSVMSQTTSAMTAMKAPRAIPVKLEEGEKPEDAWQAYPVAYAKAVLFQMIGQAPDEATLNFNAMIGAYRKADVSAFNNALAKYEAHLASTKPPLWNESRVEQEAYFNHVSPFYVGMLLYVLGFTVALFGCLFRYRPLNWAAFTLILLTFLFHTVALAARIYISGRPPVTNLYSSAVFIGWGAVLLGLAIEGIFRIGIGNVVGAAAGFATLLIAYFLAAGGDTITVMQAVLDTQFWLATHVVCITFGYTATYIAGFCGLAYVLLGWATPILDANMRKVLGRIIYGVVCFALLFSFFGTVLGGLWADDSWGRFWGWDPKENGALIIVLWNALILHSRWDKQIADRGLAVLSVGGNIVTSWSWFGVNQLGIGLHSYGFTNGVAMSLVVWGFVQLVVIALGCLPTRMWWSYQADQSHPVQHAG